MTKSILVSNSLCKKVAMSHLQWISQGEYHKGLPDNIWFIVLTRLGLKDLGSVMQTCKGLEVYGKQTALRKLVLSERRICFDSPVVPKGLMLGCLQDGSASFFDVVSPYIGQNMVSVMVSGDTLKLPLLTMIRMSSLLSEKHADPDILSFPSQDHSDDTVKWMLSLNPKSVDLYKATMLSSDFASNQPISVDPEIFLGWQVEQLGSSDSNLKEATLPLALGNKAEEEYDVMADAIKAQNPSLISLTITNDNGINLQKALLARRVFSEKGINLRFSDGNQLLINLRNKIRDTPIHVQQTDLDLVTPQFYAQQCPQFNNSNLLLDACLYLGQTPKALAILKTMVDECIKSDHSEAIWVENRYGYTALSFACRYLGHSQTGLDIIKTMLDECIAKNPDALWQTGVSGWSAFMFACQYLRKTEAGLAILKTMVEVCIAKNPEALWQPNNAGWTVLMFACLNLGQTPEALEIIERMVDVCIAKNPDALLQVDNNAWSVLLVACRYLGQTPKALAVIERILDECIKNGYSDVLWTPNNAGWTVLMFACQNLGQTPEALEIIKTMLDVCIKNGHSDVLWTPNSTGVTVLMFACHHLGKTEAGLAILKTMVDECIKNNDSDAFWSSNCYGETVLMYACRYLGQTEAGLAILKTMVDECIKNNDSDVLWTPNSTGVTVLMFACRHLGNTPEALAIIERMLDVCIKNGHSDVLWTPNSTGVTALDQIKGWSDSEIKQELIQKIESSRVGAVAFLPAKKLKRG